MSHGVNADPPAHAAAAHHGPTSPPADCTVITRMDAHASACLEPTRRKASSPLSLWRGGGEPVGVFTLWSRCIHVNERLLGFPYFQGHMPRSAGWGLATPCALLAYDLNMTAGDEEIRLTCGGVCL